MAALEAAIQPFHESKRMASSLDGRVGARP